MRRNVCLIMNNETSDFIYKIAIKNNDNFKLNINRKSIDNDVLEEKVI